MWQKEGTSAKFTHQLLYYPPCQAWNTGVPGHRLKSSTHLRPSGY